MFHIDLTHIPAIAIALILFIAILFMKWLGYAYSKWLIKKYPGEEPASSGSLEGSLLGLTALLLAFTFGMASSKFDSRRQVVIEEANNIGTAVLRCNLYPDSVRSALLSDFRKYVSARVAYFDADIDEDKIRSSLHDAQNISANIWDRVASLSNDNDYRVRSELMIPALNSMIDIVTTRESARIATVPQIIFWVLFILVLVSAFLAGYGTKSNRKNDIMTICFAVMTTITIYLVLELDRPRSGIINIKAAEKNIEEININLK